MLPTSTKSPRERRNLQKKQAGPCRPRPCTRKLAAHTSLKRTRNLPVQEVSRLSSALSVYGTKRREKLQQARVLNPLLGIMRTGE